MVKRERGRVDEFGLGSWWPRPEQAAAGALDHLPIDQWAALAARWIAAGYDSPALRQLADFRARDIHATLPLLDLMPEAMRSIGFDPAPANDEFAARCQSALDIVQRDLDATGYGQYQMRAALREGWPAAMLPTLPDGSYWGGAGGMSREMRGSSLLWAAADSASGTIKEIYEVEWPVCAVHGGHPDAIWDGEGPVELIDRVAWWHCTNTGHPLAPVGQLTATLALSRAR